MRHTLFTFLILLLTTSCACTSNNAPQLLQEAEQFYLSGHYNEAKLMIDSLRYSYPEAYNEIKTAITLFRKIELAEQLRSYNYCDSMGNVLTDRIAEKKRQFVYLRNKAWESEGCFYPRGCTPDDLTEEKHLRCGVMDNGGIRLVSVYSGKSPIRHTSFRASIPDNTHANTPSIPYDKGLNYRFSDGDTHYELVTYERGKETEVIQFIINHPDDRITITFQGSNNNSFVMNDNTKRSITQCYELAALIADRQAMDSNKKKALQRINYLKMKEEGIPIRRKKSVTEEEYESMNSN